MNTEALTPLNPAHEWFNEARFGMFVHWGAYSAGGRGEWAANRERIPFETYKEEFAQQFRAEHYNPREWTDLAADVGMRYAVLTARHHDGFALWPTQTSEFHAGNIGPKRDLVGSFVEACRASGLKVGLYFSPADWFHPDYPGSNFRDWPGPQDWRDAEARERFIAYYRAQLRELLTGYGKIDYLWYDGCIPANLCCPAANEEALALQPNLLINERNGPPAHVMVSEQAIKPAGPNIPWEACMTLNDNWGYHANDHNWKAPIQVVSMLIETAANAGNLLLNVGPRPDGRIPEPSERILRDAGEWVSRNDAAIRNSERSPFSWFTSGRTTVKGNRVYLNLLHPPIGDFCYAEIANRVLKVRVVDGGDDLAFEQQGERLVIHGIPAPRTKVCAISLTIDVEGTPRPLSEMTTFWIPG